MSKRYAAIWFRYLTTDWLTIRQPILKDMPFVYAITDRGRRVITAINPKAQQQGAQVGMVVADAKAFISRLQVFEDKLERSRKLLKTLGLWCIRYTPVVAIDEPDGLILDISGCTHLWGGEKKYINEIISRLRNKGYASRAGVADTPGAAWAIARFGQISPIVESGQQMEALLSLPPAALRLEPAVVQRLQKLGLHQILPLVSIPRSVLRRRFGDGLIRRLRQAFGQEIEYIQPLQPIAPYEERLPCLEPIRTAVGIEIAVQRLLSLLCKRLTQEGKGLRAATLTGYRVDGKKVQVRIGANRATRHVEHLFKLFEWKIPQIEPDLGIELFVLEAQKVESVDSEQEALWTGVPGLEGAALIELLDRLGGKMGMDAIQRFLPDAHYWPERSIKKAVTIQEKNTFLWTADKPRPTRLLSRPDPIDVSAPIPDYPPMVFRYKGKTHQIKKADGPERIEREWWLDEGAFRDYYCVEDEDGQRYWLFRLGHYTGTNTPKWFIHGFFA